MAISQKSRARFLLEYRSNPERALLSLFDMVEESVLESVEDRIEDLKDTGDNMGLGSNIEGAVRAILKDIRGEKGDNGEPGPEGYTPIKGVDYFTPVEIRQFIALIETKIPTPKDGEPGKDGKTPRAGIDYPTKSQILQLIADEVRKLPAVSTEKPVMGMDYFTAKDVEMIASKVTASLNPEAVRDALQSLKGDARLDATAIKNLPVFLKNIGVSTKKRLARGTAAPVMAYDLSGQCNGVLKVFSIPTHARALMLLGTQFPIVYRPSIDWTTSGQILTLTGEVGAPETGQTLILLYVE